MHRRCGKKFVILRVNSTDYEQTLPLRCLRHHLPFVLRFHQSSHHQLQGIQHLCRAGLLQYAARNHRQGTAHAPRCGVRPWQDIPPRGFPGLQGAARRNARGHQALRAFHPGNPARHAHPRASGRRVRGRRRDWHPLPESRRGRRGDLYAHSRQGLWPAHQAQRLHVSPAAWRRIR